MELDEFHVANASPVPKSPHGGRNISQKGQRGDGGSERGTWVCGSPGDWIQGGSFFSHLLKGVNRKRALFFPQVHSASKYKFHVSGFGFETVGLDFLKSPQPMAACHMSCFALFSCCQFDSAKYYAAPVRHGTPWELAKLIPAGWIHLSHFKAMAVLYLGVSCICCCFSISNTLHILAFMCRGCLKDLAKGLVKCDFLIFPENLKHMVSLWPMQIPRETRRFWFTGVKCRFWRGDLHWSKSHVILMQRGHGPNWKKCWCQEFQKPLGLSALFSLM